MLGYLQNKDAEAAYSGAFFRWSGSILKALSLGTSERHAELYGLLSVLPCLERYPTVSQELRNPCQGS